MDILLYVMVMHFFLPHCIYIQNDVPSVESVEWGQWGKAHFLANCTIKSDIMSAVYCMVYSLIYSVSFSFVFRRKARLKLFLFKLERVSNCLRCPLICLKTPTKLHSFAIHCDIIQCGLPKWKRDARLCLYLCMVSLFQVLEVGHSRVSGGSDEEGERRRWGRGRGSDNFTQWHLTFPLPFQGMTVEGVAGEEESDWDVMG